MYDQSKALKIALIKSGKNQSDVANFFHCSRQAVSAWATGKYQLSVNKTMELSKFFGLTLSEFISLGE